MPSTLAFKQKEDKVLVPEVGPCLLYLTITETERSEISKFKYNLQSPRQFLMKEMCLPLSEKDQNHRPG